MAHEQHDRCQNGTAVLTGARERRSVVSMRARTTHTLSVAFTAVSDGLRWFGAVLPKRVIHYDGREIDFVGPWDGIVASLRDQIDGGVYRPAVNEAHIKGPRALGVVEATRVLTPEQATALGIDGATVDGVYLGVRESTPGALDGVEYVSIGAWFGHVDETGREWPLYLHELSAVDTPHIRTDQIPASQLRGVQFAADDGEAAAPPAPEVTMTPEEIAAAIEAAVAKAVAPLNERIAELEAEKADAMEMAEDAAADAAVARMAASATDTERAALKIAWRADKSEGKVAFAAIAAKFVPAAPSADDAINAAAQGGPRGAGAGTQVDEEERETRLLAEINKGLAKGLSFDAAEEAAQEKFNG